MPSCLSTDSSSCRRLRGELQLDWMMGGDAGPPPPPDRGVAERERPSSGACAVSVDGGKQTDGVGNPA